MNRRQSLAVLAAACAAPFTAPAGADTTMRLACPALDTTALMAYGNDQGFFKNAGLNVDLRTMANGEATTVAVAGNAVDIGCSEVVSLVLAYRKGVPITIVGSGGIQTAKAPVGLLFAQQNSTLKTGSDFNGKTVAVVGMNGFAQFGTQLWIDKNGGDSKTVKFIQLAGAQIAVALQDGRIDGAFVPEPFVSAVKKVARPVADSMSSVAPEFLTSAHFTTAQYAKDHASDIRKFQSVLHQSADWANTHQDQTALILERISRVPPEVVQASTRAYFGDTLQIKDLQPLIDMAAKYGGFPAFPATDLVFRG